jgi:hypothetical protein
MIPVAGLMIIIVARNIMEVVSVWLQVTRVVVVVTGVMPHVV